MRYPVTNTGTKDEFNQFWYSAQSFGNPTAYGYHEGEDINLKTGGDTDLGQEVKAIANGQIVYYHYSSHPSTNFGRHLVMRLDGPWGVRWAHYAHLGQEGFLNKTQSVTEGQIIGRLGKSGTPYAHLHFAIFKKDPATLTGGIDNIANTLSELNDVWEDPFAFINTWAQAPSPAPSPITDQSKYDFGEGFGILELQKAKSIMQDQRNKIVSIEDKISQIRQIAG